MTDKMYRSMYFQLCGPTAGWRFLHENVKGHVHYEQRKEKNFGWQLNFMLVLPARSTDIIYFTTPDLHIQSEE